MKVVIIGGSAQSTPQLARSIVKRVLSEVDVTLVSRDQREAQAVARAFALLADPAKPRIHVTSPRDLKRAIAGAQIVLLQARYGGYAGRAYDETFPLECGIPGDEGLGPGGLSSAWRSWPEIARVLEVVRSVAPEAIVLLMTAPVGILVACAKMCYSELRLFGVCELPWVTLREISRVTETPMDSIVFDYAGVNHLGWFDRIMSAENDCVTEYGKALGDTTFPFPAYVRRLNAVALKYMRLHEHQAEVVAEQRRAEPRARELSRLRACALDAFECGDVETIERVLAARPAPWYADAVGPFISAWAGESSEITYFLTARNDGYIPALAAGSILEMPHRFVKGRLTRVERSTIVRDPCRDTLRGFVTYEAFASEAVVAKSRSRLRHALSTHPWVRNSKSADKLAALIERQTEGEGPLSWALHAP